MGVRWSGLTAYLRELGAYPDTLTHDAQIIADQTAMQAADEIRVAYPVRSGQLRDSLTTQLGRQRAQRASAAIINTAPYAAVFETGSMARHTSTGADRGPMPAAKIFYPISNRHRRAMVTDALVPRLEADGATVRWHGRLE
jgi:hypothetical protein